MASPPTAGSSDRVNVVLSGMVLPGHDATAVKTKLAALIKRDIHFTGRLLSGYPTKIKSGVDVAAGDRYVAALKRIGVAANLEAATLELDADIATPERAVPKQSSVDMGAAPRTATNSGASTSPPRSNEDLYRAAIGPSNLAYYLSYFARADAAGKTSLSWNWPAFFFVPAWYIHRKLYGWGVFFAAFAVLVELFDKGLDRSFTTPLHSGGLWSAHTFVLVLLVVVPSAVFANGIYYRRTQRLLSEARSTKSLPADQLLFVRERGGVLAFNGRNWLIGLVVVLAAFAAMWVIGDSTPRPPAASQRPAPETFVDPFSNSDLAAASPPVVVTANPKFDPRTAVPINPAPTESLRSSNRAQSVSPTTINERMNQAWERQDYEEAERLARSLMVREPTWSTPWNMLGLIASERGRPDEAEAALRRAIELNPQDSSAKANLAVSYFNRGESERALALLKEAKRLNPTNEIISKHLATVTTAATAARRAASWESYKRAHGLPNCGDSSVSVTSFAECKKDENELRERLGL